MPEPVGAMATRSRASQTSQELAQASKASGQGSCGTGACCALASSTCAAAAQCSIQARLAKGGAGPRLLHDSSWPQHSASQGHLAPGLLNLHRRRALRARAPLHPLRQRVGDSEPHERAEAHHGRPLRTLHRDATLLAPVAALHVLRLHLLGSQPAGDARAIALPRPPAARSPRLTSHFRLMKAVTRLDEPCTSWTSALGEKASIRKPGLRVTVQGNKAAHGRMLRASSRALECLLCGRTPQLRGPNA